MKKLDISRVPVNEVKFSWLTHVVDGYGAILISKEQVKEIFGGNSPWLSYKGIPLELNENRNKTTTETKRGLLQKLRNACSFLWRG